MNMPLNVTMCCVLPFVLGLSKKIRISNANKNPHSNAKRCIRILGVRQAALSVAHEMR